MVPKLENYSCGQWVKPEGDLLLQVDAVSGDPIASCGSGGLSFGEMADYARKVGNPALRKMTFHQRGLMLKKLALFLNKNRKSYYPLSFQTGATKGDSWIDIDGGIGTLFAYASLRKQFSNTPFHLDGSLVNLSKNGTFIGHHIMVPRRGVAVHINAFNFPIWGMLEKCAVNWLAGMPAIVKAAEPTSFLTQAMVKDIIASKILPEGALQLVCGSGQGILEPLNDQDVVTFTGSASTGRLLKADPNIIEQAIPFNMEADSLNAAVLGQSVAKGTEEYQLFIKEVIREMTVKCGQKCTAIRRIIVPEHLVEAVQKDLTQWLSKVTIGNPTQEGVKMGALVSKAQVEEVSKRVEALKTENEIVFGGNGIALNLIGGNHEKGAFFGPVLLVNSDPFNKPKVHTTEAFGPVSTILPYSGIDEAVQLAQMGKGSLVTSITTYDETEARHFTMEAASHHGRILILNRESAKESTGHGSPMPLLYHGGPGRAGGGGELGGLRGVKHYLQTCAIQGSPTFITSITQQYQPGSKYIETPKHPFRYHFDEIQPGMSIRTHKRTITDADIINFANLTWDHFYAHTDITSLEGTIFEKRAAHGYFILSAAAGLLVHPAKGPVSANYGLEECRFVRPVYHNDTLYVRLTCKEKQERESKGRTPPAGVVKWYVEVFDQEDELVAMATILTLVQKKSPFNPFNGQELVKRLERLTTESKPSWGIMTPQHLVEHLIFLFDVSMGKIEIPIITPEEKLARYQESLYNHRPMPKFFKFPGIPGDSNTPLKYENLDEAKASLLNSYEAYEQYYKDQPDAINSHPVFGDLDKTLWDLLHRKHFHHHFEQFGLLD